MPLRIIDTTGQLPSNPTYWPDKLYSAIAKCCCGQSSIPPNAANCCCPGTNISQTISGNIKHTKIHDTGLTLRYWPNVFIKFGDGLNTLPSETWPPWIPRESMPFLFSLHGAGSNVTSTSWDGTWYSDFIHDYDCTYDLNGFVYSNIVGFPIRVDYRIQMEVKVYYYATFGLTTLTTTGGLNTIKYQTCCGLRIWQCAYPTGTITYTPINPFLFGGPLVQPIDYRLRYYQGPGLIKANALFSNTHVESTVVASSGSDSEVLPVCVDYTRLVCSPFHRVHVFQGDPNSVPFPSSGYSDRLFVRCLSLRAGIGIAGGFGGGEVPGTYLTHTDDFGIGTYTPDDIENVASCSNTAVNFNTDPFMEVFS